MKNTETVCQCSFYFRELNNLPVQHSVIKPREGGPGQQTNLFQGIVDSNKIKHLHIQVNILL